MVASNTPADNAGDRLVNTLTTGHQTETTIAALEGGGYVVIFQEYSGRDIKARIYDENGVPAGDVFLVNTFQTGTQNDATVASLKDGGFIVTYSSAGFDAGRTAVAAQRFDALGNKVGDEFVAGDSGLTSSRGSPTVSGLEDGGFVIGYVDDVGHNYVATQRYNADGTKNGSTLFHSVNYSYGEPAITGLKGGGYVVTEQGYYDAGETGYGIIGYVVDAAGNQIKGPFAFGSTAGFSEGNSAVAALEDGGFVAVWESNGQDGDSYGIIARLFSADGTPRGNDFVVNTVTADSQYRPSVAGLPGGGFIVDWTSQGQDGDSASQANVYAQVFKGDGAKVGDPFRINATITGGQTFQGYNGSSIPHNPTVAVLSDGTVAFSWFGAGPGDSSGIFTRRWEIAETDEGDNIVPDASDDSGFAAAFETAVSIDAASLLANDTDGNGDALTLVSVQDAVNGTVSLSGGMVTFTPADGYSGPASFTYTISDGNGGSDTATVSLTVAPAPDPTNTAPDAVDDMGFVTDYQTDIAFSAGDLTGNDMDTDGDVLSLVSVQGAVNGTVAIVSGQVVFTPADGYSGPASFTYTISDGNGGSDTATVNLTVGAAPVNTPPSGTATAVLAAGLEDTAYLITVDDLLEGFSDADGDSLSVTGLSAGSGALVDNGNGTWTLTPDANFNGDVLLSYTVSDGNGGTAAASQSVTFDPVNDAPIAGNNSAATSQNTAVVISGATLLANDSDIDGDVLTITGVSSAVNGTVDLSGGNVTFTPATGFSGAASFAYTVSDGQGGTATATVNVTVNPVVTPPPPPPPSAYVRLDDSANVVSYATAPTRVQVAALGGDDKVTGSRFDDSLNGGDGNDGLTGLGGKDTLTGGKGADRMMGGQGDDNFIFNAGDLGLNKTFDHIIDFHGAGQLRTAGGEQDFISLFGFGAGSTLTFDHYGINQSQQYYRVDDPLNAANNGLILVQMADGTALLTGADYRFG